MARRRAAAEVPLEERYPTPPAQLARNRVADWIRPGELTRRELTDDGVNRGDDPRVTYLTSVRIEAWQRRRAAVRRWLAENDVPRADEMHVLPGRGIPASFEGRHIDYLTAAGFTARQLESDAHGWRYPMESTTTPTPKGT